MKPRTSESPIGPILIMPRGSGKTLISINKACNENAVLVIYNKHTKKEIADLIVNYNLNTPKRIITHEEFLNGSERGYKNEKYVIDDLDFLLSKLVHVNGSQIVQATLNI